MVGWSEDQLRSKALPSRDWVSKAIFLSSEGNSECIDLGFCDKLAVQNIGANRFMFPQMHTKLLKLFDGVENIRKEYHVNLFNKLVTLGLDNKILSHFATQPNAQGRQYPNKGLHPMIPSLVNPLYNGPVGDRHHEHWTHSYRKDHELPPGVPELWANDPAPQPQDDDKRTTYSAYGCTDEDLALDDKLRGYFRIICFCRLQLERQCGLCPRKGHTTYEHFWSCAWCGQVAPLCHGIQT